MNEVGGGHPGKVGVVLGGRSDKDGVGGVASTRASRKLEDQIHHLRETWRERREEGDRETIISKPYLKVLNKLIQS